jgi:hypothetical protein
MLYTILCYKDEDVVTAWSAEEEAAVMGRPPPRPCARPASRPW